MERQNRYDYDDLIRCARGELFGEGNPQLPLPPMLMFDRIPRITEDGGQYGKGEMIAELDVRPNLWFFDCHFENDPVMPGCLGLDALWQMLGFFLGWSGGTGHGRALGAGEVRFSGQVVPSSQLVTYHVQVKRIVKRSLYMGIADGTMEVDGREIYAADGLRVGLFTSTEGF